jgi:hypothetical protein
VTAARVTVAAAALLAAAAARAEVERFAGAALAADGWGYREEHEVRRDGDRLATAVTRYLDPEGRAFATLRSDFSRDPFAPDYEFVDRRSGEEEAVEVDDARVTLRSARGRAELSREACPGLVTGQGLDRLVRDRLEALAAGEEVRVSLALPSRLDCFAFRVRAAGAGAPGTLRVRVEPASWLLRLLAPRLEVEYERGTRRLLAYRGVSNLAGPDGATREVEIRYEHPRDLAAR